MVKPATLNKCGGIKSDECVKSHSARKKNGTRHRPSGSMRSRSFAQPARNAPDRA